jgi:hypothetical protein
LSFKKLITFAEKQILVLVSGEFHTHVALVVADLQHSKKLVSGARENLIMPHEYSFA